MMIKIPKFIKDMLTESDNETYDIFRLIVVSIFVFAMILAAYIVFYKNSDTFTFMDFCGGMALLIAPTAALFYVKKDSNAVRE